MVLGKKRRWQNRGRLTLTNNLNLTNKKSHLIEHVPQWMSPAPAVIWAQIPNLKYTYQLHGLGHEVGGARGRNYPSSMARPLAGPQFHRAFVGLFGDAPKTAVFTSIKPMWIGRLPCWRITTLPHSSRTVPDLCWLHATLYPCHTGYMWWPNNLRSDILLVFPNLSTTCRSVIESQ